MSKALSRARIPTIDAPAMRAIIMPALAPPESLQERISYYHRLSQEAGKISIMAALAAGVELLRAKAEVEHGMFTAWIERNCEFSYRTAHRYVLLAEGVLAEGELPVLLEMPEPLRQETLAVTAESIDAKSLTQLYLDLGIVRPSPVSMGGARPGAGRPRKADPVEIAQTELTIAISQSHTFAQQLRAWALEDDALGMLPDEVLLPWLQEMQAIVKRGRDILEGRRINKKLHAETTL